MNNNKEALRKKDLFIVRDIAKKISGIHLNENKSYSANLKISRILKDFDFENINDYLKMIESNEGKYKKEEIISALTTNVTSFFRENHHFDYLLRLLCHDFHAEIMRDENIRIWSSACSSGEEAYSAAMTVAEALSECHLKKIKILGTDIDAEMIRRAKGGVYSKNNIPKNLSEKFDKFCIFFENKFSFLQYINDLVLFRNLNIIDEWPFQSKFHAIFCRNVTIYFDKKTTDILWRRLTSRLHIKGEIYIGHSERITNFEELGLRPIGISAYKKVV
ncbi:MULTISPECIES: protein-glutamate O-methyltransferase CheR [Gluconobacter]|uniref:CheR family methyltransferase n=1 Tax=Gluconobacter TaxID=441 RepID=UPI00062C097B|nr:MULTISPECIES: CheR family methyltransferase [Gluconobacter]